MARQKGPLTGRCQGCNHPERVRIERFLAAGASIKGAARKFDIDYHALRRHWRNHVSAGARASYVARASSHGSTVSSDNTPCRTALNRLPSYRLTAVSRARDILQAGKTRSYKAAVAELDERTKAHWQEQIAPELENLDEDENEDDDEDERVMHYTADAAGLLVFLLSSVLPDCLTQLGSLGIRSLIRARVLGETVDFQRLEPISRYEVHLDRKFERAVSMLLRLRELRQFNEAG